jgi:hypothetical protein
MEEFFGRLLFFTVLAIIASGVSYLVRSSRGRADLAAMPEPEERLRILDEVRKLKADGKNHSECLEYLLKQGFRRGVAEGLLVDVEREQPPDLEKLNTFEWNGWRCEYPGNWKETFIDTKFSKDKAVHIGGVGSANIIFFGSVQKTPYESILSDQRSSMKDVDETSINTWGGIGGQGVSVRGTLISHKLPMEVTIFQAADVPAPFVVLQAYAIEEKEHIVPALNLIHSTFKYDR